MPKQSLRPTGLKLTVAILNYNAGDFLLNCLKSLESAEKEIPFEVTVIDNVSSDGSFEEAKKKYPNFNYIKNEENLGFGKGYNVFLKNLKTEYVLLLNPDSELKSGTLKYMVEYMNANPNVGAASCKVIKQDGTLDWASHRGFPTPLASFLYFFFKNDSLYHLTNRDFTKPHEVDSIVGAFFLTRKSVLEKVGVFDPEYFMYGEDLDFCFRIKKAGLKVMYVPEVEVLHYKGISSGIKKHSQEASKADEASKNRAFNAFYEAMVIFYKKNLSKSYPFFLNWLVILGINLKWFLAKRKLSV